MPPPGISFNPVTSQTITTHGSGEDSSVVLIFAHVQQRGKKEMFIRVVRGDTPIGVASGGGAGGNDGLGATLVTFDHPPAGTHTYKLQASGTSLGYQFFIVEIKR